MLVVCRQPSYSLFVWLLCYLLSPPLSPPTTLKLTTAHSRPDPRHLKARHNDQEKFQSVWGTASFIRFSFSPPLFSPPAGLAGPARAFASFFVFQPQSRPAMLFVSLYTSVCEIVCVCIWSTMWVHFHCYCCCCMVYMDLGWRVGDAHSCNTYTHEETSKTSSVCVCVLPLCVCAWDFSYVLASICNHIGIMA